MEKNQLLIVKSNIRLIAILLCIALLLLIPLIAMQFRSDVVWSSFDFISAAILLLSAGLSIELILRKIKTTKFRIMAFVVLVLFLFLIWAELAVGIFGSPFSGN
jgi:hypothetical protein